MRDREFQIEMLKVQLQHGITYSYLTALMAVTVSFGASLLVSAINPSLSASLRCPLLLLSSVLFILFAVASITVFWLGRWGVPRDLKRLRENIIETQNKKNCFRLAILGIELISLEIDEN
jgi:hypothetical protein